jgi:hypothetical protein
METSIFIFGARNKHHHNIAVQHNTARLYYSNTQSWAHAHHNLTAIEGVTAEWTHTHIFTHTHRERERKMSQQWYTVLLLSSPFPRKTTINHPSS